MLLSVRPLENAVSVNNFEVVQSLRFREGDAPTISFMLIDAARDRPERGFSPAGRRYIPAAGATLQVTLININDSHKVVRAATQPFPGDLSIWALQLQPTDQLLGTVSMVLLLTETVNSQVVVTNGGLSAAISIESATGLAVLPTTPDFRVF